MRRVYVGLSVTPEGVGLIMICLEGQVMRRDELLAGGVGQDRAVMQCLP